MSKNAITHNLNNHGVLCPAEYKKSNGLKYQNPHATQRPLWTAQTVSKILKNPTYVGDMVQGRQRIKSYKIHTLEQVPQNEWFVVKNTHEGIIARAAFDKVQELLKRDTRTGPEQKQLYLFSGFLRCSDCGKAMGRSKVKNYVYYICRTYKDQLKTACTKHSIRHDELEEAVLYAIQQYVYLAIYYSEVIGRINSKPLQKSQSVRLEALIAEKEKELSKIMRYKQSLYQDWKDGEISHKDYRHMSEDYERQAAALAAIMDSLKAERAELENGIDAENPCLTAFKKFASIDKLTREVLIELVDQIIVHENGTVSVRLKFADELRRIMEYIELNTQAEAV
jgi:hypothetical protein